MWANVKLTLVCTIAWEGAMAIAYLSAPAHIVAWFAPATGGAALLAIGATMLPISAIWQVFDAIGMTLNETLRAAGDTAWTATARILIAWGLFTPASYLCVNVWHGGAVAAMLCLCGYIALLALVLGLRFRSGAWKRIELIEPKVEELLTEATGER